MDGKETTEPRHRLRSNLYQNSTKNANKNDDAAAAAATIKSVHCRPNLGNENTVNQSKPKNTSKQTAKPVAETHHYQPNINKDLPEEDEYILPDIKRTTDNQYAALGETHRVDNQYSSLVVQQDAAYQGLVGQRSFPSQYTIPRTKN